MPNDITDAAARSARTFPYSRHAEFLQLEAQARAARRGLWAGPRTAPPAEA